MGKKKEEPIVLTEEQIAENARILADLDQNEKEAIAEINEREGVTPDIAEVFEEGARKRRKNPFEGPEGTQTKFR